MEASYNPDKDYGQGDPEAAERIRAIEARVKAKGRQPTPPFIDERTGLLRINADIPVEDIPPNKAIVGSNNSG